MQASPAQQADSSPRVQPPVHANPSNIGGTIARNVRLAFDPVLTSTLDERAGVIAPRDLKPLGDVIPSLPPGKRIAVMFDIFHARDPAKYPDRYDVTARFLCSRAQPSGD